MQTLRITIQAVTGEQLKQLNVTSFDDLVKYLPNVSISELPPPPASSPVRASFRSRTSGVYGLRSLASRTRTFDVYMVDMERIEVLEGPQGTLFGGGAEAGAVRYITNKPKLNKTEGNVEASYRGHRAR